MTPSDQVDQAWHLHLTYTHDHWRTFWPDVLGAILHQRPTPCGGPENTKYHDGHAKTLMCHTNFFGTPPADVWSDVGTRTTSDAETYL